MSEPARERFYVGERFYVIGTTGYSLQSGSPKQQTSYAVCDRAFNGREVFTRYVLPSRGRLNSDNSDAKRREECEAKARELNAKHEPW